nr:hypothetical protein BaRGS_029695 [Batillaria attramentaria]
MLSAVVAAAAAVHLERRLCQDLTVSPALEVVIAGKSFIPDWAGGGCEKGPAEPAPWPNPGVLGKSLQGLSLGWFAHMQILDITASEDDIFENLIPGWYWPGTITIPHGALLMRNEQGQLMLVSAGQPGGAIHPSSVITTTSVPITTSAGLKIQRPTVAQNVQRPGTVVIQPGSGQPRAQPVTLTQPPAPRVITQQPPAMPTPSIAQPQPAVVTAPTVPASQNDHNKMMLENVKKCKNFLSTLLKLAANQPASTVKNVRDLIQGLIDSKVEPEAFTLKLQHELKSSPQPYLVPFLKKSLPMLRQSMQLGKMGIDGIKPPPGEVVMATPTTQVTQVPVQRPQPTPSAPQVVRAQVPKVTTQSSRPPIPQTLGPHSKVVMTGIRHHSPSAVNSASAAARAKGGASAAVTAALQQHTQKTEGASPAASHKEKRKFEALKDDNDDINDVATMGGVNLSEESKNILATNSELIGSQIRSCKDEAFLPHPALMARITAIAKKHGLDDVSSDVSGLISHATQQRLRDIVSKLSTIAEHRVEMYKIDPRYEVTSEVRGQLKFLEELDRLEKKRHEEQEREMLLRAMKSRSKTEDPEQQKLKQKAKELQQAEAEEMRQQQANQTALAAIGPRKKLKLDGGDSGASASSSVTNGPGSSSSRQSVMSRPRFKRANLKDLIFLMEQDRSLNKSSILGQPPVVSRQAC